MSLRRWLDDPTIRGTVGALVIMALVVIAVASGSGQAKYHGPPPHRPQAQTVAAPAQPNLSPTAPVQPGGLVITPVAAGLFLVILLGVLGWLTWRQNRLEARLNRTLAALSAATRRPDGA